MKIKWVGIVQPSKIWVRKDQINYRNNNNNKKTLGTNRPALNRLNKSYKFGYEKPKSSMGNEQKMSTNRPALGYESFRFWVRNVQTSGYKSSNLGTKRPGYETSRVRNVLYPLKTLKGVLWIFFSVFLLILWAKTSQCSFPYMKWVFKTTLETSS